MFQPSDLNKDLVGVESRIQEIETLLNYGSIDVYALGIWGIGGIGKTTFARAFLSSFDGSYFIENVSQEEEMKGGLAHLQQELFSTLLEDTNLNIANPDFSINSIRERLSAKKLLIVIDDVIYPDQIEFLIENLDRFMLGSLIIVTTRVKQVLESYGVKTIYKMKELQESDLLKLFSRHAFRQNHLNKHNVKLSNRIIHSIQGVPLVLKVFGCLIVESTIKVWDTVASKLERIPPLTVNEMLIISYEGLGKQVENIFLYIALFCNGEDRDHVINILDDKGYSAERGLRVLVDKCLITVLNNNIKMHHLLQEMARELAWNTPIDDFENRKRMGDHEETDGLSADENVNDVSIYNRVDLEKMFVIINFVLELPSAVFDQLSAVHKPQYAIVSMSLSFVAMLLCIIELVYKCGEEKIIWKWRSTLPWLYYPSRNYAKPFGNFKDIIELVCAICQCIFATITFDFARRRADSPVQISFWPIVFAFGLLCSKFLEKPVRRRSKPIEKRKTGASTRISKHAKTKKRNSLPDSFNQLYDSI